MVSCMSSNFGQIVPLAMQLVAIERLNIDGNNNKHKSFKGFVSGHIQANIEITWPGKKTIALLL